MLGLIILAVLAVYLAFSYFVVRETVRTAKASGGRSFLAGFIAAFIMYNLVFWDWIPTLATKKYYCTSEAGFDVYKTVDQWNKENPGVAATLTWKVPADTRRLSDGGRQYVLNERFVWDIRERRPVPLLSTTIIENRIIDVKTGEALAKQTIVGSGYGSFGVGGDWKSLKSWLHTEPCLPNYKQFADFQSEIRKLGKKQ
jgi:hypothetical protein